MFESDWHPDKEVCAQYENEFSGIQQRYLAFSRARELRSLAWVQAKYAAVSAAVGSVAFGLFEATDESQEFVHFGSGIIGMGGVAVTAVMAASSVYNHVKSKQFQAEADYEEC